MRTWPLRFRFCHLLSISISKPGYTFVIFSFLKKPVTLKLDHNWHGLPEYLLPLFRFLPIPSIPIDHSRAYASSTPLLLMLCSFRSTTSWTKSSETLLYFKTAAIIKRTGNILCQAIDVCMCVCMFEKTIVRVVVPHLYFSLSFDLFPLPCSYCFDTLPICYCIPINLLLFTKFFAFFVSIFFCSLVSICGFFVCSRFLYNFISVSFISNF